MIQITRSTFVSIKFNVDMMQKSALSNSRGTAFNRFVLSLNNIVVSLLVLVLESLSLILRRIFAPLFGKNWISFLWC